MFEVKIDVANAHKVMVDHLAHYIETNNLSAAVLGVSGGIDSTVVAYILNDAAKKLETRHYFRVIGISMPSETTAAEEFNVSELVGRAFCDMFKVLNISNEEDYITIPEVEGFSYGLESSINKIRIGNVKSRLRMIHLYDFAKAYNGIVIGTDNKTEMMLGFSTIGGDGLFDFCPIQHLWKTEIYALAEYYKQREIENENWAAVHALDESIKLTPQAGLGITISDMGEIGAPNYQCVDTVLYNDEKHLPQPDEEYVERVLDRKRKNAYKRYLPITTPRHELETVNVCQLIDNKL